MAEDSETAHTQATLAPSCRSSKSLRAAARRTQRATRRRRGREAASRSVARRAPLKELPDQSVRWAARNRRQPPRPRGPPTASSWPRPVLRPPLLGTRRGKSSRKTQSGANKARPLGRSCSRHRRTASQHRGNPRRRTKTLIGRTPPTGTHPSTSNSTAAPRNVITRPCDHAWTCAPIGENPEQVQPPR
jgi:hypothetical protein